MASLLADKWTVLDGVIQRLRFRKVVKFIPRNCILADLGCGSGDFLRYIHPRIALGYGIDTRVEIMDKDVTGKLVFKEGDLNERVPLDDESVDVVTSLAVLEHLYDPKAFAMEIMRILKPGGSCILTSPDPVSQSLLEFLAYKLRIISEKDIRDHKHYFSRQDILVLFGEFGFVNIARFQLGLNQFIIAKK